MDTWHSLDLGASRASDPARDIREAWLKQASANAQQGSSDPGNAVFKLGKTAYFTPAAADLAAVFKASPCDKPARDGVGLLAGDARARAIHFPVG